ncbi:MAG: hypothetical protein KJ607_13540 [Bacteroidetes bacterium]|nr:hypothetical protein [Bacteroidota bacterium]
MGKLLTILSIVAFICGNLFAQTGPGGVGNSANNELWLKADNITGLSNGDNVSTWQDASGNSNDAIQGGAYRPVYKVNTINGKPVVRFDGSNDYYDNVFAPQSSNMTIYTVFAHDHNGTSAPDGPLWQPDQSSGTSGFLPMFSNNNQYIYYGDGWLNKISEFSQATWYSSIARYGTGSTELWKDGVLNDDTLFNTITIDSFQIGRRNIGQLNYYKGDIAELIVYNTDINDAQLIIVDNYLAAKYGITIADDKYIFQALYGNEVAGIGREDASNYHTAAQSAGIMKISSPDNLGDGEYLIFGHDNADITTWTTTDAPNSGVNIRRISSEWQFDETGNVGTVTIELDNTLLPALPAGYTTYYVLQDADGVFANGAVLYPMTASGANTYEATGIDIADGDYITFAVVRPVIQFTITSSSEFEPDGPVPVQVSLNYPMGTDVTADISISGSTAIGGGVDYSLSAGIVTITAGNTTANIFISLTNDILVESSETIILYLANPSAGVVLGVNTQHTVTINDDDNPRNINFTAAGSSNNEGVTPVTVTVQINNVDAVNPTTVDYNVIGGTATGGGIDYNLADGTATVLPGDLTTIFDIFVDEDILDENDETIIITLANPQNCNLATTNTTYTYTIIDNDSQPTVQFTDSASSGSEAVSPGTIEVSLSYISGIDVTVDYTVADGTASGNGVDYTLSGGTLTIPAGNTNGYLNPVIVEDSYTEGNESFTVTLSNPVFAALGATTINTYTIIDDEMFSIVLSYTDVLCYGENTGTATAIPMGGAPPYTFLWDDDMNTTDSIVTGLYANIWYHVTVTDDSSNTLVDSFILSQPDSLWAEINGTDIICHGSTEGSVTVTATGGTTPYFYNWSPDGFTGDSTDTYSNLSANTYSVTVADANFCCDTAGFIINDAAQIIFNINATDATCSNCDGSATANAVNGTPPYVFLWSNGNTLQSIDSLCAGNYSLQITDSAGCTFDTTFSVSNTSELTASLTSITNVTCNGDNTGVAVVTPSGGILPVTYLWSNGQTESVATGLSAGVYNVTVTDDAGCSYMVNATITEPDILTITLNTADVSCNQTNDGSITVNAFGGVGNYQYSIDTGATWVFQNTFTGLFPGNYLVVVRDSIGCQVTDSAVIDSSSYLTISAYVTNTTCGWYSGSIFLNITGGSPPYSYQWHPGSWWWGSYHNHLSTGYYNITVTDDNGCTNDTIIFVGDDCPPT